MRQNSGRCSAGCAFQDDGCSRNGFVGPSVEIIVVAKGEKSAGESAMIIAATTAAFFVAVLSTRGRSGKGNGQLIRFACDCGSPAVGELSGVLRLAPLSVTSGTLRMIDPERTIKSGNDWVAHGAIALFVALSYIVVIGRYVDYLNNVLPHGDAFTYTVNWYSVIDDYRVHGYLRTLVHYLRDGSTWYRLMEVSEAALAPILAKQPYTLCIVNYVLFGIATTAFYCLGRRLVSTVWAAFAIALIPWLWPINYGFEDQTSLPVTALDAAFNAALFWAVAQTYIFALDLPRSTRRSSARATARPKCPSTILTRLWAFREDFRCTASAILTGLAIGIAVWGRGNSLPVVVLVVLWPGLLALWLAWRSHDMKVWANVTLVGFVAGLIAIQFYVRYWDALRTYYAVHSTLMNQHWSLDKATPFILNVPGFMYWRAENSLACVVLTLASHLFVLSMFAIAWGPRGLYSQPGHFAFRHLVTGGAVIYFGTYLVDMALFANDQSGLSIYQALLIWRPMLIGLSLMLVAIVAELFAQYGAKLNCLTPLPLAALALGWGLMWISHLYPLGAKGPIALSARCRTIRRRSRSACWWRRGGNPLVSRLE